MKTNKAAIKHLNEYFKHLNVIPIVNALVEGGFIEEDTLTEPERVAQAAKDWIENSMPGATPRSVFRYASGWNTSSWEYVLNESFENDSTKIKIIFQALVILAKEAGVEL